RVVVVVGDREHRLEDSLEPDVLPAVRGGILLQKRLVRALLHLNEVRNLNDRRDLAEVLTAAAPALDHSCHMFSRRTVTSSSTRPQTRPTSPGAAWRAGRPRAVSACRVVRRSAQPWTSISLL